MNVRLIAPLLISASLLGCVSGAPRVLVTPAPGIESIPTTIAVYPLLSTRMAHRRLPGYRGPMSAVELKSTTEGETDSRGIYILPPTESNLVVTGYSQLFSDLLAAELAHVGFKLKQLPVEVVENADDEKPGQFFVSMELLQRLKQDFGLQAVLIGNVYFELHRYDPNDVEVHAAYVKIVDVETLDVLCHVSIGEGTYGTEIGRAVELMATELGGLAGRQSDEVSPRN